MSNHLDLSKYNIRTDLAVEAHEMLAQERERQQQNQQEKSHIEGVIVKEREVDGVKITAVEITDQGAKALNKKKGAIFNAGGTRNSRAGYRTATKDGGSICEGTSSFY